MTQYGKQAYDTLQKYHLAPKKRFGQNFLVHKTTAEAIVAAGDIKPEETIVEVGVGLGALTLPLAKTAKRVCGFEIDSGLVRFHRQANDLPENVTLIHKDFLDVDLEEVCNSCANESGKLKILANLPYSISNPFIFKLVDDARYLESVTVMLQKEVALRLAAQPGSKEYGVPTILLASCATVKQKLMLRPDEFYPMPKVDSIVITINFGITAPGIPPQESYNYPLFKEIVRTTFNQRRKTIGNTFANVPTLRRLAGTDRNAAKTLAAALLEKAGIDPGTRPETLSAEKFIELSQITGAAL
ncbi:MAG: 16S rRNA (adenine(1518)-N(6)/adenine(1519)-N(6))-dimethyltransferase RsmA [Desulforhopalus sp.]|nr:16S rRNA (adenine(1518)-N(6)/adenine(1519)-N(6))-dimethyltransferase RsmA [Desulforhopalus sp.]